MSTTYRERNTKLPLDVFRAESAWRRTANRRTGAEWRALIDAIHGKRVRINVALIVWWDWLADRHTDDRVTDLDDLRDAWDANHEATRESVCAALVAIGYPPRLAAIRTNENAWRGFSSAEAKRGRIA